MPFISLDYDQSWALVENSLPEILTQNLLFSEPVEKLILAMEVRKHIEIRVRLSLYGQNERILDRIYNVKSVFRKTGEGYLTLLVNVINSLFHDFKIRDGECDIHIVLSRQIDVL